MPELSFPVFVRVGEHEEQQVGTIRIADSVAVASALAAFMRAVADAFDSEAASGPGD